MARKSQRLRRQRRIERARAQQALIPVEDNSVMIQKIQEEVKEEIFELFENSIIEPKIDLKSLLKRELLALAKEKSLTDVSSKNTKAQIIAAIQSLN